MNPNDMRRHRQQRSRAAAGFLTRRCCVGPAVLWVLGVSTLGPAEMFAADRVVLIALGGAMLTTTFWINMRRDGGTFNRPSAAAAAPIVFGWSMRVLRVS
jgi:hypothetical protein